MTRRLYQEMINSMKASMSVMVSIIEDDVPARQILADWIRRSEGFDCVSEHDDAESAIATLPEKTFRGARGHQSSRRKRH